MPAIISRGLRRKSERGPAILGVGLRDAREEQFARMVCDGLALGVAFARAGFASKDHNAASNLFHLPRVQERANAILEARRTTGVVSLSEVTDMLKRVFAGAHSAEEYSAAHNAAFSLARLYGHVTDRATLEVIRRPSRDPDAPSEQALASWVETLPALPAPSPLSAGPGLAGLDGPGPAIDLDNSAFSRAPAAPLGPGPAPGLDKFNDINDLANVVLETVTDGRHAPAAGPGPSQMELFNDIKGLDWLGPTPGRPENGAPVAAVTGTPNRRGRAALLGEGVHPQPPVKEKRVPLRRRQVPGRVKGKVVVKNRRIKTMAVPVPSAEDLF
jgi:hypothetical protein